MKTISIFIVFASMPFYSCTNEIKEKKVETAAVKEVTADTGMVRDFTISTPQDTTRDGESIQRYDNGKVRMQGMMKAGNRDGLWKSFYEDGKPWSETTFKDGVKNGPTTTWYENGNKRYVGAYTNDKESGKWIYYDETGKSVKEMDYGKGNP